MRFPSRFRTVLIAVLALGAGPLMSSGAFADTHDWYYYGGHSYAFTDVVGEWGDAQQEAERLGANLVTVNNAHENQWLYDTFAPQSPTGYTGWIGFYQDTNDPSYSEPSGGWKWVSGEPLTYTNWNIPEPNNLQGGEDWAVLQKGKPTWNDFGPNSQGWEPHRGIVESAGVPQPSETVYSNDFEDQVEADKWSHTNTDITPEGGRRFLGQFNDATVSLSLGSLPDHEFLGVGYDIFVMKSWDGNSNGNLGPDIHKFQVDGEEVFKTTFSNLPSGVQAYPDSYPGGSFPADTGATEVDTLGYVGPIATNERRDAVYHLHFLVPHTSPNAQLDFSAILPDYSGGLGNESWGLDNVSVKTGLVVRPQVETVNVTRTPEPDLTELHEPTSGQLEVLTGGGLVDPGKDTVMVTHDWRGVTNGWPSEVAAKLEGEAIDANVLAWNWEADADTLRPPTALSKTEFQGGELGETLLLTLGNGYDEGIHFMGLGLGATVNCHAANLVHQNGLDPQNTHVTILDAFQLGDLDRQPWAKVVPDDAFWVDNYISAFAWLQEDAANLILREGMPVTLDPGVIGFYEGLMEFHQYSSEWYEKTITMPNDSVMGHRWAFERGTLPQNSPPDPGTVFAQTANPFDSELDLVGYSWSGGRTVLVGRNIMYAGYASMLTLNLMTSPIQFAGDVAAEVEQKAEGWMLRLILGEQSSSYAWVPVEIPEDAVAMSFDFTFSNVGNDDYLTAGVEDEMLFLMEGGTVEDEVLLSSGWLEINDYAGQEAELFFGLNSDGVTGGLMVIENVQFLNVPEPATMGLLFLGWIGLFLGQRRRFRNSQRREHTERATLGGPPASSPR